MRPRTIDQVSTISNSICHGGHFCLLSHLHESLANRFRERGDIQGSTNQCAPFGHAAMIWFAVLLTIPDFEPAKYHMSTRVCFKSSSLPLTLLFRFRGLRGVQALTATHSDNHDSKGYTNNICHSGKASHCRSAASQWLANRLRNRSTDIGLGTRNCPSYMKDPCCCTPCRETCHCQALLHLFSW